MRPVDVAGVKDEQVRIMTWTSSVRDYPILFERKPDGAGRESGRTLRLLQQLQPQYVAVVGNGGGQVSDRKAQFVDGRPIQVGCATGRSRRKDVVVTVQIREQASSVRGR